MSDVALKVTDIEITRSSESGAVHTFNAKLNGIQVRDIKFFTESENILPPGREYISRKDRKANFWRHVVLSKDERAIVSKAFKKVLKAKDAFEDDD